MDETFIEMTEFTGKSCNSGITALNEYLYDFYESELKFQIEESQVKCIQVSVENTVEALVKRTTKSEVFKKHVQEGMRLITCKNKIDLFKAYLKLLKDDSLDIKEQILPVGSFYEGTRNTFPDEFDFAVVLIELPECLWEHEGPDWLYESSRTVLKGFHEALCHVVNTDVNGFRDGGLRLLNVLRISGPASKLEFVYNRGLIHEHTILVDISPAIRLKIRQDVLDFHLERSLRANVGWHNRVLKTGHYLKLLFYRREGSAQLIINSITETELSFINEEISLDHKLVYRILKYILSSQNEEMRCMTFKNKTEGNWHEDLYNFSSYLVKTMLYKHLEKCNRHNEIGHCLIDILSSLFDILHVARDKNSKNNVFKSASIDTILGSALTLGNEKTLLKQYENVLKSYILKLQGIQACTYKKNQKLFLKPFASTVKPSVEHYVKGKKCGHVCFIYVYAPIAFLTIVTIFILGLHGRGDI